MDKTIDTFRYSACASAFSVSLLAIVSRYIILLLGAYFIFKRFCTPLEIQFIMLYFSWEFFQLVVKQSFLVLVLDTILIQIGILI